MFSEDFLKTVNSYQKCQFLIFLMEFQDLELRFQVHLEGKKSSLSTLGVNIGVLLALLDTVCHKIIRT